MAKNTSFWNSLWRGRIKFLLVFLLIQVPASAEPLLSPFPSTVPGVSIPNTHLVARDKGLILRGMAPLKAEQLSELVKGGINEILIFRNDVPGEAGIASEIQLISNNPDIRATHIIPFRWKEIKDFRTACLDSVRALRLMKDVLNTPGRGLFFHCTVGEDRTGYLAGLYRILFEGANMQTAFKNEMCGRGFAEANPRKPEHVVELVHNNVTMTFLKMAELIKAGDLNSKTLDFKACDKNPKISIDSKSFRCSKKTDGPRAD